MGSIGARDIRSDTRAGSPPSPGAGRYGVHLLDRGLQYLNFAFSSRDGSGFLFNLPIFQLTAPAAHSQRLARGYEPRDRLETRVARGLVYPAYGTALGFESAEFTP